MAVITFTFPYAVSGLALVPPNVVTRIDTGTTVVASVASISPTVWVLAITEPVYGLTYSYSLNGTVVSTGSSFTFSGTVPGTSGGYGYYTTQTAMQQKWGTNNISIWSNLDNSTPRTSSGALVPNVMKIQDAINEGQNAINQLANLYNRVTPVPATVLTFGYLQDMAAYDAGIRLYRVRGATGDNKVAGAGMVGVMKTQWERLWGNGKPYKSGGIMGEMVAYFKNWQGITDAPRVLPQGNCIAVIISPVACPYGSQAAAGVPTTYIPIVPNTRS